jgi:hypothetical protein
MGTVGSQVSDWSHGPVLRPNGGDGHQVRCSYRGPMSTMRPSTATWRHIARQHPGMDLCTLDPHRDHLHGLDDAAVVELSTDTAPVIFGFHGYPRASTCAGISRRVPPHPRLTWACALG